MELYKIAILKEFKEFLTEYKILPLAIAFIIGGALTTLVQSFVSDVVMPLISPILPSGDWQTASLALGPIVLNWGSFLNALINFVIIAFVVFLIAKMILKEEKVAKK